MTMRSPEPYRLVADEDMVDFGLGTPEQVAEAFYRLQQGNPGTTLLEGEYPTPTPDIPGDAGVPEEPNEDVRDDPVEDEAPAHPAEGVS